MTKPIIEIVDIKQSFKKAELQALLVLDKINLKVYENEIIAILGKSGSGKSTLLRIIAGLISPSSGQVFYQEQSVLGPVRGISMVFQTFGLLPWLTVLQNVELGLEALGMDRKQREEKALKAIDMIGLDGFESALPKELSGGMRQRVGFARALVVEPNVLLMDEPFSALDVLTADNLKSDLLDLWQNKQTGLNAIIFVTHNIEEAVAMADRIIVLNSNPGSIRSDLKNPLPLPRNELDPRFRNQIDRIYTLMTSTPLEKPSEGEGRFVVEDLNYRLPSASVSEITGLLETLNAPEHNGTMDLPELGEYLALDIDDLFPLTELLEILHFAKVSQGDISITEEGKTFVEADILTRKSIFSLHLKKYVPLARYIYNQLLKHPRNRALEENFEALLEEYFSEAEAERILRSVIEWGRYAELFEYDFNSGVLRLESTE